MLVVELLAYQARYQINDYIGRIEDEEAPMSRERARVSAGLRSLSLFVALVKVFLATSFVLGLVEYSSFSGVAIRLMGVVVWVFLLMVPYELVRNHIRCGCDGSAHYWLLLFLVTQGYPLRMVGLAFCFSSDDVSILTWFSLWLMASALGIVFVTPTWILEAFSYVRSARLSTGGRDDTYFAYTSLRTKSHLAWVAGRNGWRIECGSPTDCDNSSGCVGLDGTQVKVLQGSRVPRGVKMWTVGNVLYLLGLCLFVHEVSAMSGGPAIFATESIVSRLLVVVLLVGCSLTFFPQDDRRILGLILSGAVVGAVISTCFVVSSFKEWLLYVTSLLVLLVVPGLTLMYSAQSYASTRGVFVAVLQILKGVFMFAVCRIVFGSERCGSWSAVRKAVKGS